MVNNSTNLTKTNSHLSSHVIEHKNIVRHMKLEIQVMAWDKHKKEAGLLIIGSPTAIEISTDD
jgi:hypothetical protein